MRLRLACEANILSYSGGLIIVAIGNAQLRYESHGFELAEEYYGDQWGSKVLEQKFVRPGRP